MRLLSTFIVALVFLTACEKPAPKNTEIVATDEKFVTVVFRMPWSHEETITKFWQRSNPKAYADLLSQATDPFGSPIATPDDEITPGTFGLMSWDRGIVGQVFTGVGHPLGDGASASLDHEAGILTVTHTPEAIKAVLDRFPEFEIVERD